MKPQVSVEEQLAVIKRGAVELIEEKELVAKLKEGRPLRIKAGFDPTAPDLHLGHTVLIQKLRQFQELGHQVIFLVGDFTASIGDPSGRLKTRPPLSRAEIDKNVETYKSQVFKILDPQKTEVRFNSEWLDPLGSRGLIALSARYTLARMMEREDFSKRFKSNEPLSLHELSYPLLQGWDSVVLKADVELGGTDQKFNLLMGRQFQREEGMAPQTVLMMPLLEGTDGVQKMSKSYGNYIGIQESPKDIYGKVLSITDSLMWRYYELLSSKSSGEIEALKKAVATGAVHPKQAKMDLAREMVARFYSQAEAVAVENDFNKVFSQHGLPSDIEEVTLPTSNDTKGLIQLMTELKMATSNGEGRRLVTQGGVSINEEKVTDPMLQLACKGEYLLKVGKRKFKRVKFQ